MEKKSRSAIGKASRNKGKAGERELSKVLQEHFPDLNVHRTQQFCGKNAKGDASDVVGLPGIYTECKRVERLNVNEAMEKTIAESCGNGLPALFHRRNRGKWLVTMTLDDWAKLYTAYLDSKEE